MMDAIADNNVAAAAAAIQDGANPNLIFMEDGFTNSYLFKAMDDLRVEMVQFLVQDADVIIDHPDIDMDCITNAIENYKTHQNNPEKRDRARRIVQLILDEVEGLAILEAICLIGRVVHANNLSHIMSVFSPDHIYAAIPYINAANVHMIAYFAAVLGIYPILVYAIRYFNVNPTTNLPYEYYQFGTQQANNAALAMPEHQHRKRLGVMSIATALVRYGHKNLLDRMKADNILTAQQIILLERAENPLKYAQSVWHANNAND